MTSKTFCPKTMLCNLFKAVKENYKSKLANSQPIHFTQEEYEAYVKISEQNEKFDKGEI